MCSAFVSTLQLPEPEMHLISEAQHWPFWHIPVWIRSKEKAWLVDLKGTNSPEPTTPSNVQQTYFNTEPRDQGILHLFWKFPDSST